MTNEKARKCLLDWIQFATDPERVPFMDEPCSDEEIILAMRIGADALSQPSLPSNLDEAALKELQVYLPQGNGPDGICYFIAPQMLAMYKAGAELMARQFEKNRLAACDAQTKEDYERETAFVDKIIREQHRTPTFSDAINFGIEWQKKQK